MPRPIIISRWRTALLIGWLCGFSLLYTQAQTSTQEAKLPPTAAEPDTTDTDNNDGDDDDDWWNIFRTSDIEGEKSTRYSSPNTDGKKIGCICMDYNVQENAGRGACGGHGGVRFWLYKMPSDSIVQVPTDRHRAHPTSLSSQEISNLAANNEHKKQPAPRGLYLSEFYQLVALIVTAVLAALGIKKLR
ncbi:MAG: hypothetical protein IT273_02180 [Chitinophagales bacterium]|nr:hypothetical protein [Chitinophagales bacterium]